MPAALASTSPAGPIEIVAYLSPSGRSAAICVGDLVVAQAGPVVHALEARRAVRLDDEHVAGVLVGRSALDDDRRETHPCRARGPPGRLRSTP